MRLLYYNIAYATGSPRNTPHFVMSMHRYLRSSQRNFERLREFIQRVNADITGVVELDAGSFRTRKFDHAKELAETLAQHHNYCSKYSHRSMVRKMPVLRHQGNAIFSRDVAEVCNTHFFTYGFKRLVMESRIGGIDVFLVHLALSREIRRKQLQDLVRLVGVCSDRPVIVAGDFNTRQGIDELRHFMKATGLLSANLRGLPTFPAWRPRLELDFILHSPALQVERLVVMKKIRLSDHLPMIMEFKLS